MVANNLHSRCWNRHFCSHVRGDWLELVFCLFGTLYQAQIWHHGCSNWAGLHGIWFNLHSSYSHHWFRNWQGKENIVWRQITFLGLLVIHKETVHKPMDVNRKETQIQFMIWVDGLKAAHTLLRCYCIFFASFYYNSLWLGIRWSSCKHHWELCHICWICVDWTNAISEGFNKSWCHCDSSQCAGFRFSLHLHWHPSLHDEGCVRSRSSWHWSNKRNGVKSLGDFWLSWRIHWHIIRSLSFSNFQISF